MTPTATFADYTLLATLPKVRLKINSKTEHKGADAITTVTVENSSKALAFFVRLKVSKGAKGKEILPVIWQDNYFPYCPGKSAK
jgi:exo-1,4-beta-D-glucosaminidase